MRLFLSPRRRIALTIISVSILLTPPDSARAHEGIPGASMSAGTSWNWEPAILLGLGLAAFVYATGLGRLWGRAGVGRGTAIWQAAAFASGLLAIFVALVSPLSTLSRVLFSAHMLQHQLLIMVAAPMMAFSAPTASFAWGLPTAWSRGLAGWWHRRSLLQSMWGTMRRPLVVWVLYTGTLTLWHLPVFYQAALRYEFIHALEHAIFFGAALLFWRTVARCGRPGGLNYAKGAFFIFATTIYSAVLGALMAVSRVSWYPLYATFNTSGGLSAVEDQQLAGVIMGIPANLVHLLAVVALLWAWFNQMERQERSQLERMAKTARERSEETRQLT